MFPVGSSAHIHCRSETAEVFVAGARFDQALEPFAVRPADIDPVQYGSDDTKTHRKIKHILGQKPPGQVGRLLVSELFTVGAGGWSGYPPHKHDSDRLPEETRHNEIYNFRFRPENGFGLQLLQAEGSEIGKAFHVKNASTLKIAGGYHPCVVAPGHEMYYFTILAGGSQRSLRQFFQPSLCLSGRDHTGHQGHDREVPLTARRRLREYRPASRPARITIRTINCCSADQSVGK